jgi:hypothetical protein
LEGDVVKFIDPWTGKEVARVAAPFADSSVKFEARLEDDNPVLVDPGSGGEVARVKVRFVESVCVDRVDRVPEVSAPAGVKYYRAKLVGDQLLVIDDIQRHLDAVLPVTPPIFKFFIPGVHQVYNPECTPAYAGGLLRLVLRMGSHLRRGFASHCVGPGL